MQFICINGNTKFEFETNVLRVYFYFKGLLYSFNSYKNTLVVQVLSQIFFVANVHPIVWVPFMQPTLYL